MSATEPAPSERAAPNLRRTAPTLGIGLPVYNGERYLAQALDAVLGQTFADWTLVVVDNASTDGTAAIAKAYASRDDRIRYHRNAATVGAAENHNIAFELASGRYFKWVAHDDAMEPTLLERCVDALERDPGTVLAYARTRIVGPEGEALGEYAPTFATDAAQPAVRFASMLTEHKCFQIFGVIRRDALDETDLIGRYSHGDGVLLAHLALLGRFVEIPEFLFCSRDHGGRSSTMIGDYWSYAVWFDPKFRDRLIFPHWRMFGEYARVVLRAPLSSRDRAATAAALLRVVRERWRLLRGDLLYHLRPKLVAAGVPERLLRQRSALGASSGPPTRSE